jgi:ubiquinol-cytochrome c reductase cytochrome b subunit
LYPEWYFLPFYAILRAISSKLGGVLAMIGAILIWFLLPILNISYVRSSIFRPWFQVLNWILLTDFLILGWVGQKPVESPYIEIAQVFTLFYFFFFLVVIPSCSFIENRFVDYKKI